MPLLMVKALLVLYITSINFSLDTPFKHAHGKHMFKYNNWNLLAITQTQQVSITHII